MFDGFVAFYWTLSFLSYFYAPPPLELEFKALSFCLVCVCVCLWQNFNNGNTFET